MDQRIEEIKSSDADFKQKELALLEKFEDKIDANSKKLDQILIELKKGGKQNG